MFMNNLNSIRRKHKTSAIYGYFLLILFRQDENIIINENGSDEVSLKRGI